MYKIKDNVDLRILKLFGYEFCGEITPKIYKRNGIYTIEIDVENGEITKWLEEGHYPSKREVQEKDIKELIEADLVEEVKE